VGLVIPYLIRNPGGVKTLDSRLRGNDGKIEKRIKTDLLFYGRVKYMKNILQVILLSVFVLAGVISNISCQPGGAETVLLQGAVTIGPLSPVQQAGVCPTAAPGVFTARKLIIYDESGKKLVREVYFTQIGNSATGYYTAQISPGTYTIDINRNGIDRAEGLPKKISAAADETITIDVNIDTGIR
jgi:hypothetical protein